ncbi:hypothetical protein HPB52_020680 [Rhipicephalus sanguineus]|uniref:Uncharacterized protein n=1 Tax=Rhipicephalus sanguineus TaxID=34632 RepID=A0A9D4Q2V4_RHISA|nr:hypothetical protein HPB52_020680 [Rhipicephalus sanguineus]
MEWQYNGKMFAVHALLSSVAENANIPGEAVFGPAPISDEDHHAWRSDSPSLTVRLTRVALVTTARRSFYLSITTRREGVSATANLTVLCHGLRGGLRPAPTLWCPRFAGTDRPHARSRSRMEPSVVMTVFLPAVQPTSTTVRRMQHRPPVPLPASRRRQSPGRACRVRALSSVSSATTATSSPGPPGGVRRGRPLRRLGRLTLLDPAAPLFVAKLGLSHLSGRGRGPPLPTPSTRAALADLDIYVNGGERQPKCRSSAMCSHVAALVYYAHSVERCATRAHPLPGCWTLERRGIVQVADVSKVSSVSKASAPSEGPEQSSSASNVRKPSASVWCLAVVVMFLVANRPLAVRH